MLLYEFPLKGVYTNFITYTLSLIACFTEGGLEKTLLYSFRKEKGLFGIVCLFFITSSHSSPVVWIHTDLVQFIMSMQQLAGVLSKQCPCATKHFMLDCLFMIFVHLWKHDQTPFPRTKQFLVCSRKQIPKLNNQSAYLQGVQNFPCMLLLCKHGSQQAN